MELTDRQRNYRDSVREFSDQEIAPLAKQIDEIEEYPRHLFEKLSDFGLFGIQAPKEYGGQGLDTVSYAIAVEEVSRVCGSTGIMVAAHNSLGLMPFILFGNDDQKQEYIPILANGKEGLGSFGLTEPGAGSDAGATKTTAVQDGDHWVVNGNKCFITNAGLCRVLVTTAKTEKIPGSRGITSFIVDRGTPGFIVGKKEDKMGLRGSDTRELAFESMRLPVEKVLGKEGDGFKQFMIILDGGRISIAAMALGLAQGAFDYASHHVKTTSYLGKPKTDYQSYQWKMTCIPGFRRQDILYYMRLDSRMHIKKLCSNLPWLNYMRQRLLPNPFERLCRSWDSEDISKRHRWKECIEMYGCVK